MLTTAAMVLAMAVGQNSTAEDFREFGDLMTGRWSGDVTLIADWPGLKKKAGEKLVNYHTRTWVADKKGFISNNVGGETSGFSLCGYDPIKKRIWMKHIDSAGGSFELTVRKESSTKWAWTVADGQSDGKKLGGAGHWTFSEDGKSYVLTGNVTIDGKPTPKELRDTYTTLDK
jgi:hypothetical protein